MRTMRQDDTGSLLDHLLPRHAEQERLLGRIHEVLASSNGRTRIGAQVHEVLGAMILSTVSGQLAGYAFRETSGGAGATVVLRLRAGLDAGGSLLVPIALTAGESTRDWFLPYGIGFTGGLYVEVIATNGGTVEGSVFTGPVT